MCVGGREKDKLETGADTQREAANKTSGGILGLFFQDNRIFLVMVYGERQIQDVLGLFPDVEGSFGLNLGFDCGLVGLFWQKYRGIEIKTKKKRASDIGRER